MPAPEVQAIHVNLGNNLSGEDPSVQEGLAGLAYLTAGLLSIGREDTLRLTDKVHTDELPEIGVLIRDIGVVHDNRRQTWKDVLRAHPKLDLETMYWDTNKALGSAAMEQFLVYPVGDEEDSEEMFARYSLVRASEEEQKEGATVYTLTVHAPTN